MLSFSYHIIYVAEFNGTNYAMVLANRSVILCKIKELQWAIQDLNSCIDTKKYPPENLYKLHQRLSKSHEYLESFDMAINDYTELIEAIELSNLSKAQKLQIKKESAKSIALCKKKVVAKNFVSFECKENNKNKSDFPKYSANHPEINNASGILFLRTKYFSLKISVLIQALSSFLLAN